MSPILSPLDDPISLLEDVAEEIDPHSEIVDGQDRQLHESDSESVLERVLLRRSLIHDLQHGDNLMVEQTEKGRRKELEDVISLAES